MKIAVAGSSGLIGSQLTALARKDGHEVVEIARQTGFDLLVADGLTAALTGVEAVVDVTQSPTLDEAESTEFFTTVAGNLGRAATEAGVARTVVLSIVGTDLSPDYGYYVAKTKQEKAARVAAPGVAVLRATQFHDFAGQMLQWNTSDGVAQIIDVPLQPVATSEIVALLLDLATGAEKGDIDLTGPKQESLVDLARRVAEYQGSNVKVEPVPGPASMAGGSMLPGPNAVVRGPDWQTWFDALHA